jgi:hypothetical protein
MVAAVEYNTSFSANRRRFFSEKVSKKAGNENAGANEETKTENIELLLSEIDYGFLAKNKLLIEDEFNHLFDSLKKHKDRIEFWLYCYYCCLMLEQYYKIYGSSLKAAEYGKKCEEIKQYCDGKEDKKKAEQTASSLAEKLKEDLKKLAKTPKHATLVQEWLGFANIYRIHFTFCRIFVKQSLMFAHELKWLVQLENLLHRDIDDLVKVVNAPAPVFNVLSVGLFAARFLINVGAIFKHMLNKDEALNQEIFKQELYKRHAVMLNDIAWGTVNLLTNYSAIFHLSAPVANWLTAGFLVFDVALLLHRYHLAGREYSFKKEQYDSELFYYKAEKAKAKAASNAEDEKYYQDQENMLGRQLAQLEIQRKTKQAALMFNIAAAVLLMAGFSASLMLTGIPAAVTVCYLVCTIAVAMYITADIYGKYRQKVLMLQALKEDTSAEGIKEMEKVRSDMYKARNELIIGLAKNIVMPLLIITLFVVCWEAAVVLTALYIGYELLKGYCKKPEAGDSPRDDRVVARHDELRSEEPQSQPEPVCGGVGLAPA